MITATTTTTTEEEENKLYQKILDIERNQGIILYKLDALAEMFSKMNTHIDFVENLYDTIRTPFSTFSRITLPSFKTNDIYKSVDYK